MSVVTLARALISCGHQSAIFATDLATAPQAKARHGGLSTQELADGSNDVDIRLFPLAHPYRLAYSPALAQAVAAAAADFDVVHIHSLFLHPQFTAWRAARRARVPHVVSPRGALDPFLRQRGRLRKAINDRLWQRRMIESAMAIHLTSEDERRLIEDLDIHAPRIVVPNAIDLGAFQRLPAESDFRARHGIPEASPVILNHGRIAAKKGLDILVRAFPAIAARHAAAQLVLVGPDEEGIGEELRALASALNVTEHVRLIGPLRGDAMLEALAAADVWALPSHSENFGMAVVEAMAAGLPVLISPQVNIAAESAAAGAARVAPNTPDAFAAELIHVLDQPVERRRLGAAARTFVQRYDIPNVGRQMEELYRTAGRLAIAHEEAPIG